MNDEPQCRRPLPVAAPPRVRDRLAAAHDGPLRVVHRGPHALYLALDGWCLGIVDDTAAQVPCALRTSAGHLAALTGAGAVVQGGRLRLDGRPVVVGRLVGTAVPTLTARALARARTLLGRSPRRPARLDERAVDRLVGAGGGLTPYGDDVLCGWLAAHRAAAVPTPAVDAAVRARLHRTTLLSATLLDCALGGEVVPEYAAWVAALGGPDEPAAERALLGVGHSSGRGLLAGGRQALAELADRTVAA